MTVKRAKAIVVAIAAVGAISIAAALLITGLKETPLDRYRELLKPDAIIHYKTTSPANTVRPLTLIEAKPESNLFKTAPAKRPVKETLTKEVWYNLKTDILKELVHADGKLKEAKLATPSKLAEYNARLDEIDITEGSKENYPELLVEAGREEIRDAAERKQGNSPLARYQSGQMVKDTDLSYLYLRENGTPVRIVSYRVTGKDRKVTTLDQHISGFERLPLSESGKVLMLRGKAGAQLKAHTVGMTRSQARKKIGDFPYLKPFWLGSQVNGVPLKSVIADPPKKGSSANVYFAYGKKDEYTLEINESPANSKDGRLNWSVTNGIKRTMIGNYTIKIETGDYDGIGEILIRTHDTILIISGLEDLSKHEAIELLRKQLEPL